MLKKIIVKCVESIMFSTWGYKYLFTILKWHNKNLRFNYAQLEFQKKYWIDDRFLVTPGLSFIKKLGDFKENCVDADVLLARGYSRNFLKVLLMGLWHHKPVALLEDGFVRSLFPCSSDVTSKYKEGMSFTLDTKGFYFSGACNTDLENLLNSYELKPENFDEAKQLINSLIKYKISKYNAQNASISETTKETFLGAKQKVLVIEQSYGDQSLKLGLTTCNVFEQMISDAIKENPQSKIFFKRHPDNINRNIGIKANLDPRVNILYDENPMDVLPYVDKVYVATSQLGLEALFFGKEVHVYGLPFYAGWGLTHDKLFTSRRKRKLGLEELFYIVYLKYSKYITNTNVHASLEDVIQEILTLQREYFNKKINEV